jgi:hypothetical protein
MASLAERKYSTFFGSGFRAGHTGLQKIEVVRTATKNSPSYEASRSIHARCISFVVGSWFMVVNLPIMRNTFHRFSGVDVGQSILWRLLTSTHKYVLIRDVYIR